MPYYVCSSPGKPFPAANVTVVSVSHRQIIVSFRPGDDQGFSQTITCQYSTDSADFSDASSGQYSLNYRGEEELAIENLEPSTTYFVRLESDSACDEGRAIFSDVLLVNTRSTYV